MLRSYKVLAILILLTIGFTMGCSDKEGGSSASPTIQEALQTTVTLDLGTKEVLTSEVVSSSGGTVHISQANHDLDGLELIIPGDAYNADLEVEISATPIRAHSGNANFDPVTPLISVHNGGQYAQAIMTLKIPVDMQEGYHYMAFYYEEDNGTLEGIPELEHDNTSLTIATRHFSDIVVNRVPISKMIDNHDSGFRVQTDSWPFTNYGSAFEPKGICSGMSVAALYYYTEKKQKLQLPSLFGIYTNGTDNFEMDDDQAIKLCSVIQKEYYQGARFHNWTTLQDRLKDYFTFLMFSHSILVTGAPQYVAIYNADISIGHAMIVYKSYENKLFIYDPNIPDGDGASIVYEAHENEHNSSGQGSFEPYTAQWNAGSDQIIFNKIYYIGKSAYIDHAFDALWSDLDDKKMDDRIASYGYAHSFFIIEPDEILTETVTPLTNNYRTPSPSVKVQVNTSNTFDARITAYINTVRVASPEGDTVDLNLHEGDNTIGFLIEADINGTWTWTDFKYFNIIRGTTTATIETVNDQNIEHRWDNWPNPEWCPTTYDGNRQYIATGPCDSESIDLCPDVASCYYYIDHNLHAESLKQNYKKNGVSKTYAQSTRNLTIDILYIDDMIEGTYYSYFESGNLNSIEYYENGLRNGISKTFYENTGTLHTIAHFFNNKINGTDIDYYESGILATLRYYINGVKTEQWKWYGLTGELGQCIDYTYTNEGADCMP